MRCQGFRRLFKYHYYGGRLRTVQVSNEYYLYIFRINTEY